MEEQQPPRPGARGAAPPMNLHVHSTTGTRYELAVPHDETVDGLKRRISQRLKVPKERLTLLYKETRLNSGKLQDLGVLDGSRLTLLPTVEAGLMSQMSRPEQSVMQALESLTEMQVNDFLSGRSPLTLALRVGDHMMFVQLQLAAQQAGGSHLQHRHLITRGTEHNAAPHFRTLHTSATPVLSRLTGCAPASSQPAVESSPAASTRCDAPRSSSLTTSVFRSRGEGVAVSPCAEQVPCSNSSSRSSDAVTPTQAVRPRKPGAVIESFVNHAPGVFSGTFSGTLHPHCQDSTGRPRRDIGTILQILNDLLSATRHYQGMPSSLTTLRCHSQCASSQTRTIKATSTQTSNLQQTSQPTGHCTPQTPRLCRPPGDRMRQTENKATRCKVERLQLLMHQKRLRRKARRDSRAPYQWLPTRKSSRTSSNSSTSSGDAVLEIDYDDSLWKPDVKPELNSEFVVA